MSRHAMDDDENIRPLLKYLTNSRRTSLTLVWITSSMSPSTNVPDVWTICVLIDVPLTLPRLTFLSFFLQAGHAQDAGWAIALIVVTLSIGNLYEGLDHEAFKVSQTKSPSLSYPNLYVGPG
jgi:hypothetical protein